MNSSEFMNNVRCLSCGILLEFDEYQNCDRCKQESEDEQEQAMLASQQGYSFELLVDRYGDN